MKKILLVLLVLVSFINVNALGRNQFVMDDANLLSVDTENYILEYSNYLRDEVGVDFVVMTIDVENIDLDQYTTQLYDYYHVSNKGILIVANKSSRAIQIQVGTRFSDVIPDDVINDYIEQYMVGYLKNDEWDEGIKNGYTAFFKMICNYYDINSEVLEVYDGDNFLNNYLMVIVSVIVFVCTMLGYNLIKYFKRRYMYKYDNTKKILNDVIFFTSVFINVELFVVSYYLGFKYFVVVFIIEMISIISSFFGDTGPNVVKIKNENRDKIRTYKIKRRNNGK